VEAISPEAVDPARNPSGIRLPATSLLFDVVHRGSLLLGSPRSDAVFADRAQRAAVLSWSLTRKGSLVRAQQRPQKESPGHGADRPGDVRPGMTRRGRPSPVVPPTGEETVPSPIRFRVPERRPRGLLLPEAVPVHTPREPWIPVPGLLGDLLDGEPLVELQARCVEDHGSEGAPGPARATAGQAGRSVG
jgi:hypothetical protein